MILKACENDISEINILGKLLYENFEKTYLINEYLKNENYIILVSKSDHMEGFAIFYKNIDFFELELIIISEQSRNKGIASNLIQTFITEYCKKGDEIILEVSNKNKIAIKLYEKYGFQTINIRKNYYNDSDAYVMKKVI